VQFVRKPKKKVAEFINTEAKVLTTLASGYSKTKFSPLHPIKYAADVSGYLEQEFAKHESEFRSSDNGFEAWFSAKKSHIIDTATSHFQHFSQTLLKVKNLTISKVIPKEELLAGSEINGIPVFMKHKVPGIFLGLSSGIAFLTALLTASVATGIGAIIAAVLLIGTAVAILAITDPAKEIKSRIGMALQDNLLKGRTKIIAEVSLQIKTHLTSVVQDPGVKFFEQKIKEAGEELAVVTKVRKENKKKQEAFEKVHISILECQLRLENFLVEIREKTGSE